LHEQPRIERFVRRGTADARQIRGLKALAQGEHRVGSKALALDFVAEAHTHCPSQFKSALFWRSTAMGCLMCKAEKDLPPASAEEVARMIEKVANLPGGRGDFAVLQQFARYRVSFLSLRRRKAM
jgi:hypothetical protein